MSRRSAPGLGQWLTVTLIVAMVFFLLYKLLQYGSFRQNYPAGLAIAGINVGGMTREEAEDVLIARYQNAPIIIYHGENRFEIAPSQLDFTLDLDAMISEADYEKAQQDYWSGFWGFLWGRPVEIGSADLYATHDPGALRDVIESAALTYDQPAQPAQPVPGSFYFQYGEAGIETNIDASMQDVQAALYRPTERVAYLTLQQTVPDRAEINLLARLIINSTQEFEQGSGGVASIYILDLQTGDEITINADEAMSAMGLMKTAVALDAYRSIRGTPTVQQTALISETLLALNDDAANELLRVISGGDSPELGARSTSAMLNELGLANSFIAAPFGEEPRANASPETPANTSPTLRTSPGRAMQTTAEDMGTLLAMIYYCAESDGGALAVAFDGDITQEECQQLVTMLSQNSIGSLIEQGVPEGVPVAHRHGWIDNTHGDAGIVYSNGGAYVIVQILYKPVWLEWEISSPLMADISRATFNFFNFDEPYLGDDVRSN